MRLYVLFVSIFFIFVSVQGSAKKTFPGTDLETQSTVIALEKSAWVSRGYILLAIQNGNKLELPVEMGPEKTVPGSKIIDVSRRPQPQIQIDTSRSPAQ